MKNTLIALGIISLIFLAGCATAPQVQNESKTKDKEPVNTNINSDKKLDLSNQKLTKLPESLFSRTGLEELNISNNLLTGAIPAEIRHLQNLKVLNAGNNQMAGVPAEIGQLKYLRILNLSNNQLTGLPYELGNLQNLETLDISGNSYSEADLNVIQKKLPVNVNIIK